MRVDRCAGGGIIRAKRRNPVVIAVVVGALTVGGCSAGRPSDAEWQSVWDTQRDMVPDTETFQSGGWEFCEGLLGTIRAGAPELRPPPTEALDDAVEAWIDHAEGVAFDCPQDTTTLDQRLKTLEVLEAEINAGLSADLDQ